LKSYMAFNTDGISVVAPFTGAWIEIIDAQDYRLEYDVAPFTGAWIEILSIISKMSILWCRTLHGCVD